MTHCCVHRTLINVYKCEYACTNNMYINDSCFTVLSIIIGMTQVVLHYAHTFEIFMFHFLFQSD
ncbi:hypothetical protein GBAR_LOCUS12844, partial [Geodia barretti]